MVYIPDVNADSDIVVVNGGFDADSDWVKSPDWSIAAGVASMFISADLGQSIYQIFTDFVIGNVYEVTFTLSNVNFPFAGDGIFVRIGDDHDGIVYDTNDTFTSKIVYRSGNQWLRFTNWIALTPQSCDLDNVSIVRLGAYPDSELGIAWPNPPAGVIYEAADHDEIYKELSWNGKTNCDIKYTP